MLNFKYRSENYKKRKKKGVLVQSKQPTEI